jgi:hypothetical protein
MSARADPEDQPETRSEAQPEDQSEDQPEVIGPPPYNLLADGAFALGALAILPIVGVLAGPLATALSILAMRRAERHPERPGRLTAAIAFVLGAVMTLVQFTGAAVIAFELRRRQLL